jgi:hypothetical protein
MQSSLRLLCESRDLAFRTQRARLVDRQFFGLARGNLGLRHLRRDIVRMRLINQLISLRSLARIWQSVRLRLIDHGLTRDLPWLHRIFLHRVSG